MNVYEARGQFSKLLDEAEAGEEIVIARNGKPVVKLVPIEPPKRALGRWRGKVPVTCDEQWRDSDVAVAELFAKAAGDNE